MIKPPVSKCIQIDYVASNADGSTASSKQYFLYSGSAPTGADMTALCGVAVGNYQTYMDPHLHAAWTGIEVSAVDLTSDTSATGSVAAGLTPALSGGRLPSATSLVVARETGRRYRGGHSRVYLPVGDITKLSDDRTWDSDFVYAVASDWSNLESATAAEVWGGAGTTTSVVVSWYLGNAIRTSGTPPRAHNVPQYRETPVTYPILTWIGRAPVGSQRRRMRPA